MKAKPKRTVPVTSTELNNLRRMVAHAFNLMAFCRARHDELMQRLERLQLER